MFKQHFRRVVKDQRGSTAFEYAFLAAVVGISLMAAISAMGSAFTGWITQVNTVFTKANN